MRVLLLAVIAVLRAMGRPVVLMKLFGAIRAFEFMAFAGHTSNRNSHNEQEKSFHRRAS